jgi:hypothetical protein
MSADELPTIASNCPGGSTTRCICAFQKASLS